MAEVVGILKAVLTADTSGFDAPLKASAKAVQGVDANLKTTTGTFGKMRASITDAGTSLGNMLGPLKGVAAVAGVGFGASEIINFGKSIFAAAGEAVDLSNKLGISTQAAQQFKFAAEQTGTNVGTVGTAIIKMNNALTEGNSGTIAALTRAGLSISDLRAMRPEDAFLAITDAVKTIKDPMVQTQVALELFGKAGAELLPGIREGFREVADSATYMSDSAVRAFETVGDELAALGSKILNWSGNAVAALDDFFRPLSHWMRGGLGIGDVAKDIVGDLNDITTGLRGASDMSKSLIPPTIDLAKAMKEQDAALAPVIKKMKEKLKADEDAAKAAQQHADKIKALGDTYNGTAIRQQIADTAAAVTQSGGAMNMMAGQATALAAKIVQWRDAGYTIPPVLKQVETAATAVWAANLKMSDSIKVVSLDLSVLQTNVIPVTEAFKQMQFATDLATKGMTGMGVEVNTMSAVQLPKLATTITSMSPYLDQQRAKTQAWGSGLSQLGGIFGQFGGQAGAALGGVAQQFGRSIEAGGNFATGMKNFSSFSVQSIGNIANAAQGVMSMINSMQGMTKSHAQNAPSKWGAAASGAMQGAQVGMMFGPWGAAVGAGVGAIAGFFTASSVATKANDVRDDLQKQFGGFAAAQKVIGDFGNDPVLMETYGNFYTAGTAGAVQDNYSAFTDRLKELTEARDNPPAPNPWSSGGGGGGWDPSMVPPGWGWTPVETEPPSFQDRPMEKVTGAGTAALHPGDYVGVPPSNAALLGSLQNIERMLARQPVELAVNLRSAMQTAQAMAITLVASLGVSAGQSGGWSAEFNSTGATLIVVSVVSHASNPDPVVTDSQNNTYTALTPYVWSVIRQRLYYVLAPNVSTAHSVRVTSGVVISYPAFVIHAFAGATSFGGPQSGASGSASPLACGLVTPSVANALIVTGIGGGGAGVDTPSAGFTKVTAAFVPGLSFQSSAAYLIQTAAAAVNPTWTWDTGARSSAVSAAVFLPPLVPTLTTITPPTGHPGTTVAVTLTGTQFTAGSTLAISGSGITVTGVLAVSSTSLAANFVVSPTAALGPRTLTVTTEGGTSNALTFTLTKRPPLAAWWTIEGEFNGRGNGWTDWSADVMADELSARYGLLGSRPTDLVAGAGTFSFTLDNSAGNSAGKVGYYSPQHANKRAGFQTGMGVRLSVQVPGYVRHYKFVGTLESIQPLAGIYGPKRTQITCTDWLDYASRAKVNALGVQLEKRSDQLFALLVASLPVQPRAVQIGTGVDVYPFAFDNVQDESRTILTELARLAKSEGGRIYIRGDDVQGGTLVFEPRGKRIVSSSNVDTFSDAQITGLDSPISRASIINRAIAVTNQRRLGATNNEVLYDSTNRIGVAALTTLQLFAPYRDPDAEAERIAAIEVHEPSSAAGDYSATVNEDGTGGDLTASITIDAGDHGNGAHVDIVNSGPAKAWVWFRIRGRPLVTYRTTVSEAEDAASIVNQGESAVTMDMPYQSDAAVALEVARHTIRLFAQPNAQPVVQFVIGEDESDFLDRVVRREIGDRVGILEEVTGLVETAQTGTVRGYFITSIELRVTGGVSVAVTWSLQPADQGNYWRNNVQGAGNVSLMIVAPGNLIGHADIAHGDVGHLDIAHSDAAHVNVAHQDGAHGDVIHSDLAHGDHADTAAPHQDWLHQDDPHDNVAHSDVAFADSAHSDASSPHYDRTHLDRPFYDAGHADSPHDDVVHTDIPHVNNAHQDFSHDDHQDGTVHYDGFWPDPGHHHDHFDTGIAPGYHGDSIHGDLPHSDWAFQDSGPHVDNAHADQAHGDQSHGDDTHEDVPPFHQDAAHGDSVHGDVAHEDDAHDDLAHGDHNDSSHVDTAHVNIAHVDGSHGDSLHGDVVHGDYPHLDTVHRDSPHLDEG